MFRIIKRKTRKTAPRHGLTPLLSLLEDRSLMSVGVYLVTNPGDSGAGTLRAAIESSRAGDVIEVAPELAGETVVLQSPLVIDHGLRITGPLKNVNDPGLRIDGGNAMRIMEITSPGDVTIENLELVNGLVVPGQPMPEGGPAAYSDHLGGAAIDFDTYGAADLTINNCFFVHNYVDGKLSGADATGGAIDYRSATGVLTVSGSRFVDNMVLAGMGAMGANGTGADGGGGGSAYGGAVFVTGADVNIGTSMFVLNHSVGGMGGWGGSAATLPTGELGDGGDGGMGGAAYGGALYVNGTGVTSYLKYNTFHNNNASSGLGGPGGMGTFGGAGGAGGTASGGAIVFDHQVGKVTMDGADLQWNYTVAASGGAGGQGAVPAQGGAGGNGGDANGGAIFCLANNGFDFAHLQFNGNGVFAGPAAGGVEGYGGDAGGGDLYPVRHGRRRHPRQQHHRLLRRLRRGRGVRGRRLHRGGRQGRRRRHPERRLRRPPRRPRQHPLHRRLDHRRRPGHVGRASRGRTSDVKRN
ncbi:MAG: hypothetical protein U0835_13000 [Isosphaeraceae bacterium]